MRRIIGAFLTFVFCVFFVSCTNSTSSSKSSDYITNTMVFMDTVCTIKIYDNQNQKLLEGAFSLLKNLDAKFTSFTSTSEISKINSNAGKAPVKVSAETLQVIQRAINYSKISNGAYDITVYPLVKLWGISNGNTKVPSDSSIKETLKKIDYKKIVVDANKSTVYIPAGFGIDLGSIAKGYAAELVEEYLAKNGVKSAIVNFGGNIDVIGKNPDNNDWQIGIKKPFTTDDSSVGKISEANTSIVTSGTYERYFKVGNKIYHHIFNLTTGYPEDNGLDSVTIVTKNSENADALSTTVFLKGLKNGYKYVESQKDMEGIFITTDNKIYVTSGLSKNFTLIDSGYTVEKMSN